MGRALRIGGRARRSGLRL